jgi:GH25 family lysozyme M1 (1,4-beta-N-acetylmuramidase)
MALKVIDCSRYDNDRVAGGVLNFAAARSSGVFAGVCRWGVGNSKDAYFTQNLTGIKSSGMQAGAYWVPYPGNDHVADAHRFLDDIRVVLGELRGAAVVLDVEDFTGGAHVTRAEVEVCRATLYGVLGRRQFDYFPRWWLQAHEDEHWSTLPVADPWWDSAYPYGNNPPPVNFLPTSRPDYAGWTPVAWQFTSAGQIPGMSDRTDVSSFFGSVVDWARLTEGDIVATLDQDDRNAIADAVAYKLKNDTNGFLYAVRQEVIKALGDDSHTYLRDETNAAINGVLNGVKPLFTDLNSQLDGIAAEVARDVIAGLPPGTTGSVDYDEVQTRARAALVDVLVNGTR